MTEIQGVYNLLLLTYPEEDAYYLSKIINSKKEALKELVDIPVMQGTPSDPFCEDLRDYLGRLRTTCGEIYGLRCKKFLLEQLIKNPPEEKVRKIFLS